MIEPQIATGAEIDAAAGTAGGLEIGLNAAIVAVVDEEPAILTIGRGEGRDRDGADALPFGPFDPLRHRTLELGLRAWVQAQTALHLGHVEQLYTFGDRGRLARPGDTGPHVVSVGYLALTRIEGAGGGGASRSALAATGADFRPWYDYFPWEDWREGRPSVLDEAILPAMRAWRAEAPDQRDLGRALGRAERMRLFFGEDGSPWDEEKVLERYETLYEAGLVAEARRDGRPCRGHEGPALGRAMSFDHRRILATAISRLRAKLKYRPVVFELMPESFTLTELQKTVEAISGRHLHKQNFRRLVETAALVEATGETSLVTGGRPASLYRFRRDVLRERPAPGFRLGSRG
ncbi:NUDIX hydrolase [Pinisolibacter aquiterrae]|uniref:NUDIX hydrolase n=1 Tax=Pinisolibacter aquiterrae TaxID=2815579 RepID=UPI001E5EC08B|nr:NAD regulator [Pinisolibacter aquiterrae]MCC8237033.1 NAD regulator [Pinisolibacter aquiterrae]